MLFKIYYNLILNEQLFKRANKIKRVNQIFVRNNKKK